MKNQLISEITRQMIPYLDNAQMEQLQEVLQHCFWNVQVTVNEDGIQQPDRETNAELLDMFLSSKRVEGCSEKTLRYDDSIVRQMVECIKVYHDGRLQIILGGGYELEEHLESKLG